jgi:predicted esterase
MPHPKKFPLLTIEKHYLSITKTARFFTLGNWRSGQVSELWLVLHGYNQLAGPFLESFRSLVHPKRFFIAPEALSRFYSRHQSAEVGASWMTSEERNLEISDYIDYLNRVVERIQSWDGFQECRKICLGFSQGTATLSRWAAHTPYRFSDLVLYGGKPAVEFNAQRLRTQLGHLRHYLLAGDRDRFLTQAGVGEVYELYRQAGLPLHYLPYAGGHEITAEGLQALENAIAH